jgi:hypothetical protein
MEFVLKLAHKKGGPQAMLRDPCGGNTFTRRYLLENLATHDVFSEYKLDAADVRLLYYWQGTRSAREL